MVYLLNCEYRFCDSRKSDKCFLVFAKFAKVMNVLSVLRIMQKWHAETREGPVFMQLKCMSLLLDGGKIIIVEITIFTILIFYKVPNYC